MPKIETLPTITTGSNASQLNDAFAKITTAMGNTLSRDGSASNTMSADFDMNGNDILNAKDVSLTGLLTIDGVEVRTASEVGTSLVNSQSVGFATRADLVTWANGKVPNIGTVVTAAGYSYRYIGSGTAISDLAGWVPNGASFADHWAANTTPGTTDMAAAINAGLSYGGTVHLTPNTIYAVSTTVILRTNSVLTTVGVAAKIKLLAGANCRILQTYNYDAQKASSSAGITTNSGIINVLFDGNSANNATGSGLFIAEAGCVFKDVTVKDFAGTGLERGGFRTFAVAQTMYRIEVGWDGIQIYDCGSLTAYAVDFGGPGDAWLGNWAIGDNNGRVRFTASSCDANVIHVYATGALCPGEYAMTVAAEMTINFLEVRQNWYGGVNFTSDGICVGVLRVSKNGRSADTLSHVSVTGNRFQCKNVLIETGDPAGGGAGTGAQTLLIINGNYTFMTGNLTGNISSTQTAPYGIVHTDGSQNKLDFNVYGVNGPALKYDLGTKNNITINAAFCVTAIEKNSTNAGGSFIFDVASNVTNKITGSSTSIPLTERWFYAYAGSSVVSCRLLSSDIPVDATGNGQLTLAHGMIGQGDYSSYQVTKTRPSTGAAVRDAVVEFGIESRDATNVYIGWKVITASATPGALARFAVLGNLGQAN